MKRIIFAIAATMASGQATASPLTDAIQSALAAGCAPWIARQNYPDVAPGLAKQGWKSSLPGTTAVQTREGPWGYVLLQLNTNGGKYASMPATQRDRLLQGARPAEGGADYDAAKVEKRKCSISVRVNSSPWSVAAERAALTAWIARTYPQSTPVAPRPVKIAENFTMSVTPWAVPKGVIAIGEASAKAPKEQYDLMFLYEER